MPQTPNQDAGIYEDGTYLERHTGWHEEDSPWKASHVLRALKRHGISPTTVGEVGTGAGEVLRLLSEQLLQADCEGWDISPQAHALSQEKASERVRFILGDVLDSEIRYDLMLALDVFEHVPDYIGFLERLRPRAERHVFHIPLEMNARSALLPGSLLAARYETGHIHHFCQATALATLQGAGYTIYDSWLTAGALESGAPLLRTRVANLARRALPDSLASRLVGGYSLLVLCGPEDEAPA